MTEEELRPLSVVASLLQRLLEKEMVALVKEMVVLLVWVVALVVVLLLICYCCHRLLL